MQRLSSSTPKNFGAQFNTGVSYLILEVGRRNSIAFKAAAALRPNDAFVQFSLGNAYGASGRTLEAIDALKEAIRLDPRLVDAHRALGAYYGRLIDTMKRYARFLKRLNQENDADILFDLGLQHLDAGSYQDAIGIFKQVISFNATLVGAYVNVGIAHERLGYWKSH